MIAPYTVALIREMELSVERAESPLSPAHTLYFGGGTPSLLEPGQVAALVAAARGNFGLIEGAEVSLEVNPGSVDEARLTALAQVGVNRISIGVQSSHAADLAMFGRSHTFTQAAEAFAAARRAGFNNVSLDLIYGAPGQTRAGWRETLEAVLAWEPAHVSLYSLTLEPGTRLAWRVEQRELPAPDPDLAADMYDDACEWMASVGLRQYEISNWARPGFECLHNRQYWINGPFFGFGAGAHGFVNGSRYWNVKGIREYMARVDAAARTEDGLPPAVDGWDRVDRPTAMAEMFILNLRLVEEGIDLRRFEEQFGLRADEVYGKQLSRLENLGLLRRTGDILRLDRRAYLLSNQVFVQFMPDA